MNRYYQLVLQLISIGVIILLYYLLQYCCDGTQPHYRISFMLFDYPSGYIVLLFIIVLWYLVTGSMVYSFNYMDHQKKSNIGLLCYRLYNKWFLLWLYMTKRFYIVIKQNIRCTLVLKIMAFDARCLYDYSLS